MDLHMTRTTAPPDKEGNSDEKTTLHRLTAYAARRCRHHRRGGCRPRVAPRYLSPGLALATTAKSLFRRWRLLPRPPATTTVPPMQQRRPPILPRMVELNTDPISCPPTLLMPLTRFPNGPGVEKGADPDYPDGDLATSATATSQPIESTIGESRKRPRIRDTGPMARTGHVLRGRSVSKIRL